MSIHERSDRRSSPGAPPHVSIQIPIDLLGDRPEQDGVFQAYEEPKTDSEDSDAPSPEETDSCINFAILEDLVASEESEIETEEPTVEGQGKGNRFSLFSSALESTVYAPTFSKLFLPNEDIRRHFSDGLWWLDVNGASKRDVIEICKAFNLHPLTIEDISTCEMREKIELFPSYYFTSFQSFEIQKDGLGEEYEPSNIYVVVFRDGLLSFNARTGQHDHAANVRHKMSLLKSFVALSSDWICFALIDDIVDKFYPHIHRLEENSDAVEDEVFFIRNDDASNVLLRNIGRLRRNCLSLSRLLSGKVGVLRSFTKRCNENYKITPDMDIGLYLDDVLDHVITMVGNLGHCEIILARSLSNYLATLSIINIQQGNDTNRLLNKIILLATAIVPIHLISVIFGMNVRVPWQSDQVSTLAPFGGIVGCMAVFFTLMLVYAKRARVI